MRLSAEQRHVLTTLSTAGSDGVAQPLLSAQGCDASLGVVQAASAQGFLAGVKTIKGVSAQQRFD
jgi:hypothetical protein